MPANLLGAMAVGSFYIVTVVLGLCATRCLERERPDDDDVESDASDEPPGRAGPTDSEMDFLRLLETSLVASPVSPLGATANHTMTNHVAPGDVDTIEPLPTTPAAVRRHNLDRYAGDERRRLSSRPPPLPAGGKYILAERNIGAILGSLSLLAIKTGGVIPSAIAQEVYSHGLVWCQLPLAISLGLIIGSALFSHIFYSSGTVTIADPFQNVYGVRFGIVFIIPILAADLLFAAVVLSSLGALLNISLGFTHSFGVICSVVAMLFYLLAGGLYAGTFTDAAQYIYLSAGLLLLGPFAVSYESVRPDAETEASSGSWLGAVSGRQSGLYIDQFVMLVLGSIPVQSYFQRVLSSKSSKKAHSVSLIAAGGCLLSAVPPTLVGIAAKYARWSNTTLGHPPTPSEAAEVLPLSIAHLLPSMIMLVCLAAFASGLLASGDSALFGIATIVSHNVYRTWWRPTASGAEVKWFAQMAVVVVSGVVMLLCLVCSSWHFYWSLPFDLLFVLVFPQLFCVVYFKYSTRVGALSGLIVGVLLRLSFGEPLVGLPALLPLPFYTAHEGQLFPYRTLAMLANLLTVLLVSPLSRWLRRSVPDELLRRRCNCAHDDERPRRTVDAAPSPLDAAVTPLSADAPRFVYLAYNDEPQHERITAL